MLQRCCCRQPPPVVLSEDLVHQPEGTLRALCATLDIPWDPAMLSWPTGARPEDGCWAPWWYASTHNATGRCCCCGMTQTSPSRWGMHVGFAATSPCLSLTLQSDRQVWLPCCRQLTGCSVDVSGEIGFAIKTRLYGRRGHLLHFLVDVLTPNATGRCPMPCRSSINQIHSFKRCTFDTPVPSWGPLAAVWCRLWVTVKGASSPPTARQVEAPAGGVPSPV